MCAPIPQNIATVYTCIVCMEQYNNAGISLCIKPDTCNHRTCPTCCRSYFNKTLEKPGFQSSELIQCPSPNCQETFQSTDTILKSIFSNDEIDIWWNQAIIKTFIVIKIYCPMDQCQAVFDTDRIFVTTCTFTECYECRKGFCIACQSPWHPEIRESHPIRNEKEDLDKTMRLAEHNRWTRCPGCLHMVEMKDGCNNLQCICGRRFCYGCGRGSEICVGGCYNYAHDRLNQIRQSMYTQQI